MRFKPTFLLLLLVVALGLFILLVERKAQSTREREDLARKALEITPEHVSYLSIESADMKVECAREGNVWMIVHPVRAKAEPGSITRILTGLENLPRGEVITPEERKERGVSLAAYGLENPSDTITVGDSMHRRTILVGGHALLGGAVYIKEEQQDDVVATTTNLLNLLPKSVSDLRNRTLFEGGPERVQRMDLRDRNGFIQITRRKAGLWFIEQPLVTRAAPSVVRGIIDALYNLRVARFVSDGGGDLISYGLDDPSLKVSLYRGEKEGEVAMLFGNTLKEEPSLVYVKSGEGDSVYAVSTNILGQLGAKVDELRDRRLLALPIHEIGYVHIRGGERSIILEKKGADWNVVEPKQYKADRERVNTLLRVWTGTRIQRFVDGVGTNLDAYGLADPSKSVTFAMKAIPENTNKTVSGAANKAVTVFLNGEEPGDGTILVGVDGEEPLYGIKADVLDTISLEPLYYRNREVLTLDRDDVVDITVEQGAKKQMVKRDGKGIFRPTLAEQYVLDDDTIQSILMVVAELKAYEFVADDPEDLAPYGLKEPEAIVTLGLRSEAGISKSILFGSDAGASGVYAMLRGRDVVFILEKTIRAALLQDLYITPSEDLKERIDGKTE